MAYSILGTRATVRDNFNPYGPRFSAISAISVDGPVTLKVFNGETINGDKFVDCLQNYLVPTLNPFNGIYPCSVVLLGTFKTLTPL